MRERIAKSAVFRSMVIVFAFAAPLVGLGLVSLYRSGAQASLQKEFAVEAALTRAATSPFQQALGRTNSYRVSVKDEDTASNDILDQATITGLVQGAVDIDQSRAANNVTSAEDTTGQTQEAQRKTALSANPASTTRNEPGDSTTKSQPEDENEDNPDDEDEPANRGTDGEICAVAPDWRDIREQEVQYWEQALASEEKRHQAALAETALLLESSLNNEYKQALAKENQLNKKTVKELTSARDAQLLAIDRQYPEDCLVW